MEPLKHFQLKDHGIIHIIDIETMPSTHGDDASTLIVLHLGDVDKLIGTKARYPVCKVTTFSLVGDKLEKLMTIYQLNQFCRSIVVAGNFFYIVSPVSLFLIRSDKNWVSEIQTSPLSKVLKDNFANDIHKTFTVQPDQPATVKRSVLNYSSAGLKLDQSKVIALQSNILLVNSVQGDFYTVQFKFDQALIDIAEVIIQRIDVYERRVASSLCHEAGLLFVSSHCQPSCLMRVEDTEEGEPDLKRQKTQDGYVAKKKAFSLKTLDSLTSLSPITDLLQMPSPHCGELSKDFILSSGNHVESYLTYAVSHLPTQREPIDGIFGAEKLFKIDNVLLVSSSAHTKFYDLQSLPKEVKTGYIADEATIAVCDSL